MEILRPMENLLETSILKTQIKMTSTPGFSISYFEVYRIKPPKKLRRKRSKINTNKYSLKQKALSRECSVQKDVFSQSRSPNPLVFQSSTNCESSALVNSPSPTSPDPQEVFQQRLNTHLIYFRVVKKKIKECLTTSALKPSQKSLEELKNLRKDLECFLDKLETFYYEEKFLIAEIEKNPLFQEILKCAKELQDIFEKLNESEIPQLLETTVPSSTEHTLCSILGLGEEVAEALISINPETRGHLTDEQWIQDFLESKEKSLFAYEDCECEAELKFLGFTTVKSKALSNLFKKNPYFDHQSTAEWAKDHIEQQFKYNILLAGHNQDGCTKPYNVSGKYEEDFDILLEDDVVVKGWDALMLNQKKIHETPWLTDYLSQEKNSLQGANFWFHGTDHESALHIIENGIKLGASKGKKDFSSGDGFYLSTDYEMAHMWPTSRINPTKTAVVVFKVPSELFLEDEGKTFADDCDDWRNTVSFFRRGMTGCSRSQSKKYEELKYIFGPMAGDGLNARNPDWKPKAKLPLKYQLCIRDKKLADLFYADGKNIVQAMFFHD